VFIYFFLSGVASLSPWNTILSTLNYFDFYLHNYEPSFVFGFSVDFMQLSSMLAISILGGKLSYNFKIGGMYLILSVLVLILPFWSYTIANERTAFILTISTLLLFGLHSAIMQTANSAFCGTLPGEYIGIYFFG